MPKNKEMIISGKGGKHRVVSVKSIRKETTPSKEKNLLPQDDTDSGAGGDGLLQFDYRMKEVRGLFLQCLAGIYFIAFLSIYLQSEGLYGTNGVTPIKAELKLATRTHQQCLKDKFTLLCLVPGFFGLDSLHALELLALLGTIISAVAMMSVFCCTVPVFAILWSLYFSIYQVGNVFLWFQWDILLLETGVLAIIAAPWLPTKGSMGNKPRDLISMWMVKWLLFRLMFASGVVKLQSGCPTWWGLTALNSHFESQCLPTPLAYYAHHLPSWLLQLMTVGTYYIEIAVPIAFFAPMKTIRRYAFWLQILFQIAIIATGNYTFFNLLTMVLCISLLDAEFFGFKRRESEGISFSRITSRSLSFTFIGFSLYYTYKFFGLTLKPDNTIGSKITFTKTEFDWFISMSVPYSIIMGFLTLGSTASQAIVISMFDVKGCWKKFTSLFCCLFYSILCFGVFSLTLVPFTSLHKETNKALWDGVRVAYTDLQRYHIANSYGLFRRMTGVGGRPEVILEFSEDVNGPWKEYQFSYKPGNTSAAPVFNLPHQPRLDWQMWFAALGTYHDNPWLVSLTYRLLQGEKSVNTLLDAERNPAKAPKYIRASLYQYSYTKPTSTAATNKQEWWSRKRDKEYMPIFSKDHPPLVEFVKNLGYMDADVKSTEQSKVLTLSLDKIRQTFEGTRAEYVIWGALIALLSIILTAKIFK